MMVTILRELLVDGLDVRVSGEVAEVCGKVFVVEDAAEDPGSAVFAEAPTGEPQSSQKFAVARSSTPQLVHSRGSALPQWSQNRAPDRFS